LNALGAPGFGLGNGQISWSQIPDHYQASEQFDFEDYSGSCRFFTETRSLVGSTPIGLTGDNVAETVIANGFRTREEICAGDFEQYCPADR